MPLLNVTKLNTLSSPTRSGLITKFVSTYPQVRGLVRADTTQALCLLEKHSIIFLIILSLIAGASIQ
jgi:hypothetical protein